MLNVDLGNAFAKDADQLKFEVFKASAMGVITKIVFHMLDHPAFLDVFTHGEPEDHFSGWEELMDRIDVLKDIARRPLLTAMEAEKLEKDVARLNDDISEYLEQTDNIEDFTVAFGEITEEADKLIAIANLPFPKLREFLLDWHRNKGPLDDVTIKPAPSKVNLKEAFEKASASTGPAQETVSPSGLVIPAPGSLEL